VNTLFTVVLWGHIGVAFTGLAAFWLPVLSRKGGSLHKLSGKVFAGCAYLVNGSALVITALRLGQMLTGRVNIADDPEAGGLTVFLGYLAIVTLACIRHAIRVVETRRDPSTLRTPFQVVLAAATMLGSLVIALVAVLFWSRLSILFLLLSPAGLLLGGHMLRTMSRPSTDPRAWVFEHMGAMLGAGIAFHTAFAVFGLGRLFGLAPQGTWWFLPWIVPAAVGVPIAILWIRAYKRKFRGLEPGDERVFPD
jgi:hypothetical protein